MTKKEVLKHIDKIYKDIKSIKIQGATNIAIAGIDAIVYAVDNCEIENKEEFIDFVYEVCEKIRSSRPTEPMMFNGIKYILYNFKKDQEKSLAVIKKNIIKNGKYFLKLINITTEKSIKNGSRLIKDGDNVLTHCHSSCVVKTFIEAKKLGKKIHVYNTETRPLYQGRITSADLSKNKIKNTMVVDSEASFLIYDSGDDDDYKIDGVFIGCDAIGMSGSVINKIGSFGIATACYLSKIPIYICGNLLKSDVTDEIPVESRDFKEIWKNAPKGLKILNFAFDLVPGKFITGFITEFGVIKPKDVKRVIKEKYPFMFEKF